MLCIFPATDLDSLSISCQEGKLPVIISPHLAQAYTRYQIQSLSSLQAILGSARLSCLLYQASIRVPEEEL